MQAFCIKDTYNADKFREPSTKTVEEATMEMERSRGGVNTSRFIKKQEAAMTVSVCRASINTVYQ